MGGGRAVLVDLEGHEPGQPISEGVLDLLADRRRRCGAACARSRQAEAHPAVAHADQLHRASVGGDVGADPVESRLGRALLVDADSVGAEEPGHGRILGAGGLHDAGPGCRRQAMQGQAVQRVDAVEEPEHQATLSFPELLGLREQPLEPVQQLLKVGHDEGPFP